MFKENKEFVKHQAQHISRSFKDVMEYLYVKYWEVSCLTGLDIKPNNKNKKGSYSVVNVRGKCIKAGSFKTCMDFILKNWAIAYMSK